MNFNGVKGYLKYSNVYKNTYIKSIYLAEFKKLHLVNPLVYTVCASKTVAQCLLSDDIRECKLDVMRTFN